MMGSSGAATLLGVERKRFPQE